MSKRKYFLHLLLDITLLHSTVAILLFDCFWAAEVLLFSLFSVRGGWRRLPPVESVGNDIVRELMGIA